MWQEPGLVGRAGQRQQTLGFLLDRDYRFENYYVLDENRHAVAALRGHSQPGGDGGQLVFLCGPSGVGRSHLLQATCHRARAVGGLYSQYLPLSQLKKLADPDELLEGLEQLDLLCLDDLDEVLGDHRWEQALFHFLNRALHQGTRLLFSASAPPRQLGCQMPDLLTRLGAGALYRLSPPLQDSERRAALQLRARCRGLELPDNLIRYMLRHGRRDMVALLQVLEELDSRARSDHRRLTLPLVREVIHC